MKSIKKITLVLLVMTFMFAFAACGNSEEMEPFIGDWTASQYFIDGEDYTDYLEVDEFVMHLKKGGNGDMIFFDETYDFSWDVSEGNVVIDQAGDIYNCKVEDGMLTFDFGDGSYYVLRKIE